MNFQDGFALIHSTSNDNYYLSEYDFEVNKRIVIVRAQNLDEAWDAYYAEGSFEIERIYSAEDIEDGKINWYNWSPSLLFYHRYYLIKELEDHLEDYKATINKMKKYMVLL